MTPNDTRDSSGLRVVCRFPSLADRRRDKYHADASDLYHACYGDRLVLAGHPYLIWNETSPVILPSLNVSLA